MSYNPERKEKICLNCKAAIYGRFCHVCGQENIEPKEGFWHLATHLFYDIVHFDGKFFSTVKYLLFRPGYLSLEYTRGRRASYLHPIRMYVFVSAIFFLFFLSILGHGDIVRLNEKSLNAKEVTRMLQDSKKETEGSLTAPLPVKIKEVLTQRLHDINEDISAMEKDTMQKNKLKTLGDKDISITGRGYKNYAQYDSAQNRLPIEKRDGWFSRMFVKKEMEIKDKYGDDSKRLWQDLLDKFYHSFPEVLFVSLPLFALVLQLLYIRRRNQFYYVDHVIYTIHLYCAIFILLFLKLVISNIAAMDHFQWMRYIGYAVMLYMVIYTYKALRNFYRQRRAKTIFKWLLLNVTAIFIFIALFSIFFLTSIFFL